MLMQKLAIYPVALLALISSDAVADPLADPILSEKHARKTEKILRTLDTLGLRNSLTEELVHDVNSRVKDGYLHLTDHQVMGGVLTLHYELSGGVRTDNVELRYQPADSDVYFTARRKGVMANYNMEF